MSSDFSILSDNDDLPMGIERKKQIDIDERWDIPVNWQWSFAKDIAEVVSGGTPNTSEPDNFAESGIAWITPADLSKYKSIYISRGSRDISEKGLKHSSARLLPKGTVLFTSRAPIGYCVIAANEMCTNQGFKSFVLKDKISPEYIRYYLLSSKDYLESFGSGSTFKEIPARRAELIEFPIAPLDEQRRIVEKIEALMERSHKAKEALDAIPKLIEQFRQSVLAAAFRGDLTADWREQNPNIEPASVLLERIRKERDEKIDWGYLNIDSEEKNDKEIPEKWLWVSLSEIGKISGGLTKNSTRDDLPLEFPYLRVANVYSNKLDLSEIKNIKIRSEELDRVLLRKGDLLIVEGNGSLEQIGRASIWDGSINPCLHQNHLIKVRFNPIEMSEYILFWLLSGEGRSQIIQVASSTTGLHTLSLGKISKLQIPLIPLAEQHQIVTVIRELFDIIDRLFYKYQGAFSQLETLNQSILSKAFRGELVEQDPNDEPASVLLERIQKERAKENAKAKQTGAKKPKK